MEVNKLAANDTRYHSVFRQEEALDIAGIPKKKYPLREMRNILRARIGEAFHEGVVLDETVDLVAEFGAERGDIRYSLEVFWTAGKYADYANAFEVTPEFARQAYTAFFPVRWDAFNDLPLHQHLLLLAIAQCLMQNQWAYTTLDEVQWIYQDRCEEMGVPPHRSLKMWSDIRSLAYSTGILHIKRAAAEPAPMRYAFFYLAFPCEILEQFLTRVLQNEYNPYSL